MKRIIKLAQNKKDINRLTNINICIFEIELSNGCAFKISSVTGPLGYWKLQIISPPYYSRKFSASVNCSSATITIPFDYKAIMKEYIKKKEKF